MRMVRTTAAVWVGLMAACAVAQTAPATRPATRPAATAESRPAVAATATAPMRVADYSDPRKAVASFLTARDEADLRDALIIGTGHEAEVNSLVGMMGATLRLEKAAVAEYGAEGEKEFGLSKEKLKGALHSVEIAPVAMDAGGSAATITLARDDAAGQAGGAFLVKKSGALWKIDAASLFQLDKSPKDLPQQLKNATALRRVTEEAITNIQKKKYGSAQDARVEYWKESVAALEALKSGATAPATRP